MSTFVYAAAHPGSGRPGRSPAHALFERLLDQLLDQGRYALAQLEREASRGSQPVGVLVEAGYLRPRPEGGLALTPVALAASEERLLRELFGARSTVGGGRHERGGRGSGPVAGDEPRPHVPGEPLDHLDLPATLRNTLDRGLPLAPRSEDLVVRPDDSGGRCSSVLLLDLSGSMARQGKFPAARRAALALRGLVRRHFPGDELMVAGFASRAELLPGQKLLLARPHDVGLFDPRQACLRAARDDSGVPAHFTNIQAGLRLARTWLRGRGGQGRQILLIGDGEPTAHFEGDELVLAFPATQATIYHTLKEARLCAREGITLGVFALGEAFAPGGLAPFVRRLALAGRGTAVCCPPGLLARHLARQLLDTPTRKDRR